MTLLTVRDLRVGFGRDPRANEVVKGVSFTLGAGKTLAIVGESGSGKSVTALSVNRLVDFGGGRITGGSIVLERGDGSRLDMTTADEATLRHVRGRDVGMIFQEPMTSLNPVHTIGAQIEEACRLNRGLTGEAATRAAREALE
ncbi:MAG: ABC transporter ATP-binding protein, partial [Devosia sp.]|nr:ABC transporter ATP-binding protein [Devosia sp.]